MGRMGAMDQKAMGQRGSAGSMGMGRTRQCAWGQGTRGARGSKGARGKPWAREIRATKGEEKDLVGCVVGPTTNDRVPK